MSLERFCRKRIVTAQPAESILTVARRMRDEHVGCVVVVEEGRPVGMVTDRDLVVRAVADVCPSSEPVGAVMSPDPVTVGFDAQIDDVVADMRQAGVRRLPVVDDTGALRGLVSLDDVNVLLAGELLGSAEVIQDNRGP